MSHSNDEPAAPVWAVNLFAMHGFELWGRNGSWYITKNGRRSEESYSLSGYKPLGWYIEHLAQFEEPDAWESRSVPFKL